MKVRIATWVIDFAYDPKSWKDWGIMVLRALPAALAMNLVVSCLSQLSNEETYSKKTVLGW